MSKVDALIERINKYAHSIQKDDLGHLQEFEGSEQIPGAIETYESDMAKVLRDELKRLKNLLNQSITKNEDEIIFNELTFEQMAAFYANDLFVSEEFKGATAEVNAKYFREIVEDIATRMMASIDSDIPYEDMTPRTTKTIEEWSEDLAEIMQLNTHKKIERVLTEALEEGKSIQTIELELDDLPEFNRQRARTTAITEVVSASNVAMQEAYMQSPSVKGKRWKHSGVKNRRQPRPNHMLLDGVIVDVDEVFTIPGSGETCMHPGDSSLSAAERINCGCIAGPVVDKKILGLSYEEKMEIREQAKEELGLT